jgi:hypothetical protein
MSLGKSHLDRIKVHFYMCNVDCVSLRMAFYITSLDLGGCFDHNFLRFLPNFGEKIAVFFLKPML